MKGAWLLLDGVLMIAMLTSAIAVVWSRNESRELFMRLTTMQNQRDALNVEFGRLELEQATWADPARIEQVARQKLGMINPPPQDIRVIRR